MASGIGPIGNLLGKVNSNDALLVALDGGAAAMTLATISSDGIGVTSTDALVLQNTTAAAAGAQQMSGRVRFNGFGWKTDATAASQAVSIINELLPVQGTSAPTANLLWKYSVNGGAYSTILTLSSAGALTVAGPILASDGTAAAPSVAGTGAKADTGLVWTADSLLDISLDGVLNYRFIGGRVDLLSSGSIAWNAGAIGSGTDTTLSRSAAGTVALNVATATPAGGSTALRLVFGSTSGFGIYVGSGAPTVSAAQGSIYLRSDGSSTSTRLYVNTDGATTWTNVTTAA